MRAVVITRPGGPEVLEIHDVPDPHPGSGDLLVRVHATALNRADLMQRRGRYPAPEGALQHVPGLEYAGVVEAVGGDVEGWSAGERVMGLVGGGGYAEYVTVPASHALRVPASLSLEQAAAIPEAYLTAHDALFTQGRATAPEWVLVHAVASGVGVAALQLGNAFGLRVVGTSRSAWKLERVRALGLEHAVDASRGDVADMVRAATHGAGVDVVIDLVGGEYLRANVALARPRGRIVIVGLVAGREAVLDMGAVLSKRLHVVGTAMRSRSMEEKAEVTRLFASRALELFDRGLLSPVVDEVFPVSRVREAHERMETNANVGKIVLAW
ncbi:MAG TPA: NAD(P)H-quinone oxidoreductase [Longimicrobiales bacterium]|nr:NAD(P)H-quinone oxidoreductase [Longimicrobiales bacterium]